MLSVPNPAEAKLEDFQALFTQGRRWKGRAFQAVFRAVPAGEGVPDCRWAVVASKKGVDKRATRRNRAKRRLRVLIRETLLPALRSVGLAGGATPVELCVVAGRATVKDDWDVLTAEVVRLAGGIGRELAKKIESPEKVHIP